MEESRSIHWVLPSLNTTFIVLIMKVEEANTPNKYRPIALCNVIYKLISKVVANRLKPLLPIFISPEQIGYVEGCQILDGIILSHEVIHSLKILRKPSMILKLDLSKAFDKLSWTYIKHILLAFSFNATWMRWITNLISSPRFSIIINGSPSTPFHSSRGICQGDPLSPFLFVLMAEGLSRLLNSATIFNLFKRHLTTWSTPHHPPTVCSMTICFLATRRCKKPLPSNSCSIFFQKPLASPSTPPNLSSFFSTLPFSLRGT